MRFCIYDAQVGLRWDVTAPDGGRRIGRRWLRRGRRRRRRGRGRGCGRVVLRLADERLRVSCRGEPLEVRAERSVRRQLLRGAGRRGERAPLCRVDGGVRRVVRALERVVVDDGGAARVPGRPVPKDAGEVFADQRLERAGPPRGPGGATACRDHRAGVDGALLLRPREEEVRLAAAEGEEARHDREDVLALARRPDGHREAAHAPLDELGRPRPLPDERVPFEVGVGVGEQVRLGGRGSAPRVPLAEQVVDVQDEEHSRRRGQPGGRPGRAHVLRQPQHDSAPASVGPRRRHKVGGAGPQAAKLRVRPGDALAAQPRPQQPRHVLEKHARLPPLEQQRKQPPPLQQHTRHDALAQLLLLAVPAARRRALAPTRRVRGGDLTRPLRLLALLPLAPAAAAVRGRLILRVNLARG
mmetsp:Transcript_43190/g.133061  ORF Transcript_43190/g.133061 Transcript_43190/m.133061 type:complete len:413 (-) Transcript_43190:250-1488(-)